MEENFQLGTVLVGLTEIARKLGVPSKYLALISVLLGCFLGFLMSYQDGGDPIRGLLRGLMTGITATGIVSTAGGVAKKAGSN